MKKNRIPRAAKTLRIKFLIDTSSSRRGDVVNAHKSDSGWVGEAADGKLYCFPVAMLRSSDVCELTILE